MSDRGNRLGPPPELTEEQEALLGAIAAIQRAGSWYAMTMQLVADPESKFVENSKSTLRRARNFFVQEFLVKPLTEGAEWEGLARDPKKFARALEQVLSRFSRFFKLCYGIRSNRPKNESERDCQIWEMRNRGKTFGQIAQSHGITPKAAERAFKRRDSFVQKQTKEVLEMLKDELTATGFPFTKAVPHHRVM